MAGIIPPLKAKKSNLCRHPFQHPARGELGATRPTEADSAFTSLRGKNPMM